jgi:hypothetical protein
VNFFHSGDLGDVLYALPAIREMGGGTLYLESRPWTARMTPARVNVLRPLLEAQFYIDKVFHGEPPADAVNFSTFRNGGLIYGVNLAELQAKWVKVDPDFTPWLVASQSPKSRSRIVCHRSPRYHNPYFRWDLVGKHFGDALLFVGMPDEVAALRRETGVEAEHVVTRDYAELAEIIEGAHLFIGNQSSPMALAIGLGKTCVQETCLWTPDCLFPRENVRYIFDGGVDEWGIPSFVAPPDIDRNSTPAGGWQVVSKKTGERGVFKFYRQAVGYLKTRDGLDQTHAETEVDRQTAARCPWKVRRDSTYEIFGKARTAVDKLAIL